MIKLKGFWGFGVLGFWGPVDRVAGGGLFRRNFVDEVAEHILKGRGGLRRRQRLRRVRRGGWRKLLQFAGLDEFRRRKVLGRVRRLQKGLRRNHQSEWGDGVHDGSALRQCLPMASVCIAMARAFLMTARFASKAREAAIMSTISS